MKTTEWELLRSVNARLKTIAEDCAIARENSGRIDGLEEKVIVLEELAKEFESILILRRKVRKCVVWFFLLSLTAATTTLVNYYVNGLLPSREHVTEKQINKVAPHDGR